MSTDAKLAMCGRSRSSVRRAPWVVSDGPLADGLIGSDLTDSESWRDTAVQAVTACVWGLSRVRRRPGPTLTHV